MKISIVTISFNQIEFIKRAIDSILNQDIDDFEYIIVDPGSSDGSRDLIDEYNDKRLVKIYEKDTGPANGLNNGFKHATGDILGFINSDDYLLPNALNIIRNKFLKNKDLDVLQGNAYMVDENDNELKKLTSTLFSSEKFVYGASTIVQQSTFFKRNLFQKVGGFNENNTTCWDAELFFDLYNHGANFQTCDEFLAAFRIHSDSISGSGRLEITYRKDLDTLFKKLKKRSKIPLVDHLISFHYLCQKKLWRPDTWK